MAIAGRGRYYDDKIVGDEIIKRATLREPLRKLLCHSSCGVAVAGLTKRQTRDTAVRHIYRSTMRSIYQRLFVS